MPEMLLSFRQQIMLQTHCIRNMSMKTACTQIYSYPNLTADNISHIGILENKL